MKRKTLKQMIKLVRKHMDRNFFEIIYKKLEKYGDIKAKDKAKVKGKSKDKSKDKGKDKIDPELQEIVRQAYEEKIFGMSLEEYLKHKKPKLNISESVKKIREIIDYVTENDSYVTAQELKERINETIFNLIS